MGGGGGGGEEGVSDPSLPPLTLSQDPEFTAVSIFF